MYTWLQTKDGIRSLLTDFTPSDELFVAAVACYVKAAVSREVDKDLELHKSYMGSFQDFKLRLVGFTSSLAAGSTLDVEVKKLLTVDANRQGLSDFVTMQIALGAQEITTMDAIIEELMRQAAIDLQTHIVAYRCNNETIYTNSDVAAFGKSSRGKFPEGGRVLDAFYERQVPALAENVLYVVKDLVISNGHVYEVITGGTIGTGDLGSGLTDTTGAVQYIDGVAFVYRAEENALKARMRQSAWKDRVHVSAMLDNCCSRGEPATIAVEEEAHSFYGWPGLIDTKYVYRLVWSGIKFDFVDGSQVPFDEPFQLAAADFVKAKLMRELGFPTTAVDRRELSYAQRRAQLYSFHHSRALLVND